MSDHRVIFQPMGIRVEVEGGSRLRQAAQRAGVSIDSICGERATCGKCRIVVQEGEFPRENLRSSRDHLAPPGPAEHSYWKKRKKGLQAQGEDPEAYRLSCQAEVCGDLVVMVPETSRAAHQIVRKAAGERSIQIRPIQRKIYVELPAPTLADPQADWERLVRHLRLAEPLTRGPNDFRVDFEALTIDLPALRQLQATVRAGDGKVTVTIRDGREVLRVEPGFSEVLAGLAVDIGTTSIVAHLSDLRSGELLATADTMNPQIRFGEDIMSRMAFANDHEDGFKQLHTALLESLNRLARRAARQAGMKAGQITELVIVGNPVMTQFLLGIHTAELGRAPYVPAVHAGLDVRARDVGLSAVHPGAYIHLLPISASFIGGDAMGVLLAEAPHDQDEIWLLVDVGTNAELVLGSRERLVCTSTPTGPAFEGAHIEYGMRAAEGAIERVRVEPGTRAAQYRVLGSELWSGDPGAPAARGICGTGIIEAIAEMVRTGLVRPDGRFNLDLPSPNWRTEGDMHRFVLASGGENPAGIEIPITQEDVRQIQLAKAPLYVAARYLLERLEIDRPDRILLAGGFGSHIDPEKAMLIGMIPDCPLDRVRPVGNAAGDGARIALLNRDKRAEAAELSARLERIELPAQAGFQDQFTLALHFPHMLDPYPSLGDRVPPRTVDPMVARLFGDRIPTFGAQKPGTEATPDQATTTE